MNPKHVIDDTIPKIAPNIKAIFDFVGPERPRHFQIESYFHP